MDLAQLTYSVDTTSVTAATAALDQHAIAAGRVATASRSVNDNTKLTVQQLQNMQFQLQDIAVGLASGQSPFTVIAQQGSQLAQMFRSEAGLTGALRAVGTGLFAFVTNPLNVAVLGFAAAAAAGTAFYRAVNGGGQSINETLKNHERLIRQIKDAWGEAGKGVEAYAKESVDVLKFLESIEQAQLQKQMVKGTSGLTMPHGPLSDLFPSLNPLTPFTPAFEALDKSKAAGSPDILQFRRIVESVAGAPGATESMKSYGKSLLDATDDLKNAQLAQDAYRLALNRSVPAVTAAAEAQRHLKQVTEEAAEAAKKAKDAQTAGHEAYEKALDRNIKKTEELSKSTSDAFKGIVSDFRSGASAGEIFLHLLERIMDTATDKLSDKIGDWFAKQFGEGFGIKPPPVPNQVNPNPFTGYDPTTGQMVGPRAVPNPMDRQWDPMTGGFRTVPAPRPSSVTEGAAAMPFLSGNYPPTGAGGPGWAAGSAAGLQPNGLPSLAAEEAYIRGLAPRLGIDPDIAVRVAKSEGLAPGIWQSNVMNNGVRETSYGPYQMLVGGGLGDVFKKQTGMNPADPSTWRQQIDFSLQQAQQGGWGPWHGAQRVGIGDYQGINMGAALVQPTNKIAGSLSAAAEGAQKAASGFAQQFPQALQSVMGAVNGKSGGLGGLFGGMFGGSDEFGLTSADWGGIQTGILQMHGGGDVGSTGGFRMDRGSAADWARAPRFHDGLAPDEFRAVLQTGERVQSRAEVAHGKSGGTINYAPVYNVTGGALSRGEIEGIIDQRQGQAFDDFKRDQGAIREQFHLLREPS